MDILGFLVAGITLIVQTPMAALPVALAFGIALAGVAVTLRPLTRRMEAGGMVGHDVNKRGRPVVAELGGIASLFAFSISLSIVVGLQKLVGDIYEPPYLAAIAVFFVASMIGLIDDISNVKQRVKTLAVVFAALPLLLAHFKYVYPGVGPIRSGPHAFVTPP